MHDFSVGYNSIDKSAILNIQNYFLTKNKIKLCSAVLSKCLMYYWVLVAL